MFDFAADARIRGGEPGMNHKGLVTFDRKIRKDSFYLYKAYWNPEPMVHICSKRFEEGAGDPRQDLLQPAGSCALSGWKTSGESGRREGSAGLRLEVSLSDGGIILRL